LHLGSGGGLGRSRYRGAKVSTWTTTSDGHYVCSLDVPAELACRVLAVDLGHAKVYFGLRGPRIETILNRWNCLNAKQRRENRRAGKRLMAAAQRPMRCGVIRGVEV
jgi:hypothetical protein